MFGNLTLPRLGWNDKSRTRRQKKGAHPRRRFASSLRLEPLEDRRLLSVTLSLFDLGFILQQTEIAEAHAAGADLTTLIPNW